MTFSNKYSGMKRIRYSGMKTKKKSKDDSDDKEEESEREREGEDDVKIKKKMEGWTNIHLLFQWLGMYLKALSMEFVRAPSMELTRVVSMIAWMYLFIATPKMNATTTTTTGSSLNRTAVSRFTCIEYSLNTSYALFPWGECIPGDDGTTCDGDYEYIDSYTPTTSRVDFGTFFHSFIRILTHLLPS